MPADILGSEVLESASDGTRQFRFIQGPVFCQLLMADEINRASPRTQSALLQAMQEKSVTVAGQDRPLGVPFHVLATQNPIEQEGTYPLPEAQLDRFLLEIQVPYPDRSTERDILLATTGAQEVEVLAVFDPGQLLAAQALIRRMPVGEAIVELILDLVRAFRPEDPTGEGDRHTWSANSILEIPASDCKIFSIFQSILSSLYSIILSLESSSILIKILSCRW